MDSLEANIMEKSMRSVFVGNIPYDMSEETLKDIFSEVGQVVSFKLVYDRDDGKPKGYGFCEFRDQETALSAIRNLNGYEIGGRALRVDNACTEKSRMEIMNLINQPSQSSPYGEPVSSDKAPEAVSKAVASMPPEQMIELMTQMKETIQNNPSEAKKMLNKNPQLAYALLQTQVMMDIIDQTSACRMLHPSNKALATLMPVDKPLNMPINSAFTKPKGAPPPVQAVIPTKVQHIPFVSDEPVFTGQDVDLRFPGPSKPKEQHQQRIPPERSSHTGESSKTVDSRAQKRSDPRQKGSQPSSTTQQPFAKPASHQPFVQPSTHQPFVQPSTHQPFVQPSTHQPFVQPSTHQPFVQPPTHQPFVQPISQQQNFNPTTEQEKAALIMQVLQLSEEQIALLPPEQRQSILQLKSQLSLSKQ